jgi:ankyrin repeat protein
MAAQFEGVVEPALHEGYRMIAADAAGVGPSLAAAFSARFLIARQRPDGSWSGLNQRPPSSSSDFAKTAIALRAIQRFRHSADAVAARKAIGAGALWLASHQAPDTEGRTYQLLGLLWTDGDRELIGRLGRELIAVQRADGGWGSIEGRASEAYSTGEALYALHEIGITVSEPAWERGVAFLLRTQAEDGTWHVPSRLHDPARLSPPYFESDYPYGHDQFISAAGAAWSVMALARALPKASDPKRPLPLGHAAPESWIETVAFGNLAELRKLFDHGFDAKRATPSGGTTALMLAASEPEKMRLLLDRGADPTARATSGFTALVVAAQYNNAVAIDLLLDRGGAGPSSIDRKPLDVYPLAFAAQAGNVAAIERLHQAGDPVNARFRLSRNGAPTTPMTKAIRNGDLPVVRRLLDLGASVHMLDGEPWSLLDAAVHNNRPELAQLFLERGADVNQVDKNGYTPLLLAASIDFGDTTMIELLIKAGARLDVRNPEGKTSLDLAREYGHTRFVSILTTGERSRQR